MDLCQQYSMGFTRTNTKDRDVFLQAQKSAGGGATQEEIGNLLDNFNTNMMRSISSQLDVMREKQTHMAGDLVLRLFYPKCKKKHPLKECPLDKVGVCGLCQLEHDTKYFPSLMKAKLVF